MTKEDYFLYEEKIAKFLNSVREKISPDVLNGIEHYLEHAEIEMAFELLCLEVIDKKISLPQDTKTELLDLAKALGLKEHTVYEPNFWEKLNAFLSQT